MPLPRRQRFTLRRFPPPQQKRGVRMARSRRQKGALHTRGSRHHKDSSHTAIIAIVALVAVIGLALLSFSIFAPMRNLSGQATELVTLEADLLDARTNELEEAVDLSTYSADTQEALFDVTIAIKEISPEYSETGEVSEYRSEERRVGKECRSRWSP